MIFKDDQLVLGRGEVYFEAFSAGTRVCSGERYVGNTTGFQITRAINRLERFTSYRGQAASNAMASRPTKTIPFSSITDNIDISMSLRGFRKIQTKLIELQLVMSLNLLRSSKTDFINSAKKPFRLLVPATSTTFPSNWTPSRSLAIRIGK